MGQNKEILTLLKKEFVSIPTKIKNFADIFTFLQVNIDYLKHLIASDWYGNWHAYLQSVKKNSFHFMQNVTALIIFA